MEPIKVDWKKAETRVDKVTICEMKQEFYSSEDEGSAIDSDFENEKVTSPMELIEYREKIRKAMLMRSQ